MGGVPAGPELLFGSKTPITVANHPDINNCPQATMDAAKADCTAKYGSAKMFCWKGGGLEQVTKMSLQCQGDSTAGAVFVDFQFNCMMTMLLPCATQCIRKNHHGQ